MPNSLILNSNTVINANLDHFGRTATFSASITVGNTTVNTTAISVQTASITSLVVGSISTSGAGGNSTGFAITGNGSFTGALTAGSLATAGTFSAGNTTFNGTVTLGNIILQNGSVSVGSTVINANGISSSGLLNLGGVQVGAGATTGVYVDATNIAIRSPIANGGVYLQNAGGATAMGIFMPTFINLNVPTTVNGGLTVTGSLLASTGLTTDSAGNGGVRLVNGGNTNSGYIEFRSANTSAPRLGYIGYGVANGAINIAGEQGYFNFTGNGPQVNGNLLWHAGNLNPSSYATTSQLSSYAPLTGANFGGPITISFAAPYFDLVYGGVLRSRQIIDGNGNWILRNGDNNDNYMYVNTGGAIWTKQLGDLASWVNNNISANRSGVYNDSVNYTNGQVAARQAGNRWVYAGELNNDWNIQAGYQTPYNGAAVSDRATNFGNSSDQLVTGMRWRTLQLYIPNQNWINSYYAS